MVQLTDDCFAFGGKLLTVEEAEAKLFELVKPIASTQALPLSQCLGLIVAEDCISPIASPPYANSAVDGYAVNLSGFEQGGQAQIIGRAAAGHPFADSVGGGSVEPGQAALIFTGAPMPVGCDTVFMFEDVEASGDQVTLPAGLKRGANMRPAGEDVAQGEAFLTRGQRLGPAQIGLAAALGFETLPVFAKPRAVIFSTGDEVQAQGAPLVHGKVYDANAHLLEAALVEQGWAVERRGILEDDQALIQAALSQASAEADLILTSGGVSTGDEDHVRSAIEAVGSLSFWRMGIKPGRPVAMGQVGQAYVVGLPGNPVASYVGYLALVRPLFYALLGIAAKPLASWPVTSGFAYKKKQGRREYVRVQVGPDQVAQKFHKEGAGMLSGLAWASGLVMLEEDRTHIDLGDTLTYVPMTAIR